MPAWTLRPEAPGRWTGWHFAVCCAAALTTPALATAELVVQIVGSPTPGEASVTLVAPDGSSQTATDEDGDGMLVLPSEGTAGEYRLTVAVGEHGASHVFELAQDRPATLTYDPAGDRFTVTYGRFLGDEVVVTARRREEHLQSIPVAVTALTEATLEAMSMTDLSDVGDFAPNVEFGVTGGISGAPSEATVYIRGVGQIDTGFAADPGVGIYIDGVYVGRSQGAVFDLLDAERVEVMRGPQGTLFGKNTTGGAIQLITKKPGQEGSADFDLTLGELDRRDAGLRLNGALRESLFGSLSLATARRDGYALSLADGAHSNDDHHGSGRAALRWLASERLVADFTVDGTRERESAYDLPLVDLARAPVLDFHNKVLSAAGLTPLDDRFVTDDIRRSYSTNERRNDGDVWGTSLVLSWLLGDVALTSISAYRHLDYGVSVDADGSPLAYLQRTIRQRQDQLSQELHLASTGAGGRLDWLVGALYFSESSAERSFVVVFGDLFDALEAAPGPIFAPPGFPDFLCDPGPAPPGLPCFGGAGNPFNRSFAAGDAQRNDFETRSYAAFGEVSYAATSKLTATLGLRYTYEKKELDYFREAANEPVAVTVLNSDAWDNVSPRVAIAYQATPQVLVYGSAAHGFKSGGFNTLSQNPGVPVDPELVWSYEAGLKSDLAGGRVRLNSALFYLDYKDIQFAAALADDEGNPIFAIANAGRAKVLGGELELVLRPGRSRSRAGWQLSVGAGYLDATYTDLENVQGPTLDGSFPKTPDWNVTVSPEYSFDAAPGVFTLRADYTYRGRVYNDIANSPQVAQDPYDLLHARIAYVPSFGRWDLTLFGTNLTDEPYIEHGISIPNLGISVASSGRPREWGLTLGLHF